MIWFGWWRGGGIVRRLMGGIRLERGWIWRIVERDIGGWLYTFFNRLFQTLVSFIKSITNCE
jgi:hypothetical protein